MTTTAEAQERDDLNRIAAWLARRDAGALTSYVDVLVLCGSAVLASLDVAAAALHDGLAGRILVSGGVGHSTGHLARAVAGHPAYADVTTLDRTESAVLEEILHRHHAVPRAVLSTEDRSTNCGENAAFVVALLDREPVPVGSVLVLQDPTMQRRAHASFERSLRGSTRSAGVRLSSWAPFVPAVPVITGLTDPDVRDPAGRPVWSAERFGSLVLGEVRRLRDDRDGYGPRGTDFIDHVDVPSDVLSAYKRLGAVRDQRA
jgi:hypothetical protein